MMLPEGKRKKKDLERINNFFIENFCDCDMEVAEDYIQGEFYSKWTYPEGMIDRLIESLETRNDIYIRVLSYNFEGGDEYAEFTLLNPYKGYTEGTIVGDYGDRIIVSLTSGKEISEYRDEVIIHE